MRVIMHQERIKLKSVCVKERGYGGADEQENEEVEMGRRTNGHWAQCADHFSFHAIHHGKCTQCTKYMDYDFCVSYSVQKTVLASVIRIQYNSDGSCFNDCAFYVSICINLLLSMSLSLLLYKCVFFSFLFTWSRSFAATRFRNGVIFIHTA